VTDDRQTDHTTERWVAIGEIACIGAILPKKLKAVYSFSGKPTQSYGESPAIWDYRDRWTPPSQTSQFNWWM